MADQLSPLQAQVREDDMACRVKDKISTQVKTTWQEDKGIVTLVNRSRLHRVRPLRFRAVIVKLVIPSQDSRLLNNKSSNRDKCKICTTFMIKVTHHSNRTCPNELTNHISLTLTRTTQGQLLITIRERIRHLPIQINSNSCNNGPCITPQEVVRLFLPVNILLLEIQFQMVSSPITS